MNEFLWTHVQSAKKYIQQIIHPGQHTPVKLKINVCVITVSELHARPCYFSNCLNALNFFKSLLVKCCTKLDLT